MSVLKISAMVALAFAGVATLAHAQQGPNAGQGTGPVAASCGDDIAKLCANKPHDGSTRICLEQNYAKVSVSCKGALDGTGGGRGKGLGKGPGQGKGQGQGKKG